MPDDMADAEQRAFGEAITRDPQRLEKHIRSGGTVENYLATWRAERDRRAQERGETIDPATVRTFLNAPLRDDNRWGRPGATVRDYLTELLAQLVVGEADREYGMVGSDDWHYDLFDVLYGMGLIPGWRGGYGVGYRTDGTHHPEDRTRAYRFVAAAARALVTPPA